MQTKHKTLTAVDVLTLWYYLPHYKRCVNVFGLRVGENVSVCLPDDSAWPLDEMPELTGMCGAFVLERTDNGVAISCAHFSGPGAYFVWDCPVHLFSWVSIPLREFTLSAPPPEP